MTCWVFSVNRFNVELLITIILSIFCNSSFNCNKFVRYWSCNCCKYWLYCSIYLSLGTLNDGRESWTIGVNFDGSVIVGYANDGAAQGQRKVFRWTSEKGMESVESLLNDKGLCLSNWRLTKATAITPNGIVLIGDGQYEVQMENGDLKTVTRAWRAVIPRGNLF